METLLKPIALQTNVTSSVIGLCSSRFGSGSKLLICVVLVLIVVQAVCLSRSSSSSSSKLFISLFLVIVLVRSLFRRILPNPMGFVVIYRMLGVKKHSTTVLGKLEWENLKVAQWKH